MPPAWIKELGLFMTASAVVISNDAPAVVKAVARVSKVALGNRIQICDGVDDHVQIQAALDALPAAGGEVRLLEGTYNVQATINLDSNQTLRGCGRNTILTTTTADLIFLSAVGGAGTEKTGIVIADLQIDGGAGSISDCGIYFEFVDYSFIQDVYSRRHASGTAAYGAGIYLWNSDFNTIIGNTCQANGYYGIWIDTNSTNNIVLGNICQGNDIGICLTTASGNTVSANTCQGNTTIGICLETTSVNNTVSGNICQANGTHGIALDGACDNNTISGNTCQGNGNSGISITGSSDNTISGNTCQGNDEHGIYISDVSINNTIIGNTCTENSQSANNTYDDIIVEVDSDYNNIQGNTCRAGGLANKPRYGINISNADCDGNLVTNNDLYNDGFGTGSFNDAGTGTVTAAGNRT
jgi:parallel beta-helix repeat protein